MAIVVGAGIAAAGTIGGAAMSSNASKSAAQTQADAAAAQQAAQTAAQKPWVDAGTGALQQLTAGTQPGGQFATSFTSADATNSDAEQHALQQGTQAIENSAAARGGVLNSNAVQDTTKFAEDNAAQYQNQAFNQWLQNRQANLNPIQSLAGLGQSTSQNVADNNTNLALAGANATAAGQVGSANAISGGISSLGNQMSMLTGLFGNTGTSSNTASGSSPVADLNSYTPDSYSTNSQYSTYSMAGP